MNRYDIISGRELDKPSSPKSKKAGEEPDGPLESYFDEASRELVVICPKCSEKVRQSMESGHRSKPFKKSRNT